MTSSSAPLHAQTQWFHIFKSMIDQGDVARIGPYAFTVYLVIKAHANYTSGRAGPGVDRISELSGVSRSQVNRELEILQKAGLITKIKSGRSNRYIVHEKIQITEAGMPHSVATWDYVPSRAHHTVTELKKAIIAGDLTSARAVHIARREANLAGGSAQADSTLQIDLDRLPRSIGEKLRRHLNRSQR